MQEINWIENVPPAPDRPAGGHKGTFGTVVVVGGSATMVGAPALCATAALRVGAGLVQLAVPDALMLPTLAVQPSAMGVTRGELDALEPKGGTVLAVGPGLGGADDVEPLVRGLVESGHPMVLDADGLNALARMGLAERPGGSASDSGGWVLTPHPGEFKRLAEAFGIDGDPTDPDQRPDAAAALAQKTGAVVVLKGLHTVVTDGQRAYRNTTGNPALSTGGTGDVLTGAIASLWAQGTEPFEAACLGVYLHGDAADAWAAVHGPAGLLAMELAELLPDALNRRRQRGG